MTAPTPDTDAALWRMRHLIYQAFARTGGPPSVAALAGEFGIPEPDALALLHELEARHSVFLTDDRQGVLMANPFSAIPTPFGVTSNGVHYWANCAWDMFGVPAALGTDATIHATYALDNTAAELRVENGEVSGETGIVHFLKPFRQWYDDLRYT